MFNFFKRKKRNAYELDAEKLRKQWEEFEKEQKYNIEDIHVSEKSRAFFRADKEARNAAGLANMPGEYTFTCPNCGSECRGIWIGGIGDELHGRTDCFKCNIHLRV